MSQGIMTLGFKALEGSLLNRYPTPQGCEQGEREAGIIFDQAQSWYAFDAAEDEYISFLLPAGIKAPIITLYLKSLTGSGNVYLRYSLNGSSLNDIGVIAVDENAASKSFEFNSDVQSQSPYVLTIQRYASNYSDNLNDDLLLHKAVEVK